MIKIRVRNTDHEIDVRFPISENELYAKMSEIHAVEGKDTPQCAYVTEVYWPEEFVMLQDRFVNLDELNYLAKRMESFDGQEMDQFLIGITKLDHPAEKSLINLTFNLDHFTLCQDVSSFGKIGREYVLNTKGCVPTNDEDDPKYAVIGKDLIDRGLAQITSKGLLIYNPFDELREEYNGHTFPPYYYENTLISLEIAYNGQTELLQFPMEELAIRKALARLEAPSDKDCSVVISDTRIDDDVWNDRVINTVRKDGLFMANKLAGALDTIEHAWDKLSAVIELAETEQSSNIIYLAKHLNEFSYICDVEDTEGVGHFLVDNVSEYEMNIEMEDYFDFSGFGEHFAEEHDGQFVNGGFVYGCCSGYLEDILENLDTEEDFVMRGI